MRRYLFLTGTVLILLGAAEGCGALRGDTSAAATPPNAIPWTQDPGNVFKATPAGRACGAADLGVSENGNGVWHGQATEDITFTNSAPDACFFQGPPPLQLVSPGKAAIEVQAGSFATQHVDLMSKQQMEMIVGCSSMSAPTAVNLIVNPVGGGSLPITVKLPAACSDPSILAFQESSTQEVTGVGALLIQLNLPATAARGKAVNYSVTLINETTDAVSLTPCPSYTEQLNQPLGPAVSIVKDTYLLNCQAVSTVPVKGSLVFQMVMQVPANWQAGPVKFLWTLEVAGQPAAGSILQIN
jgi:hypothetical protein